MKLTIVIDRVVLDGIHVPAEERSAFSEALASSLEELLVAHPPSPGGPAATSRVRGHPISEAAGGYDAGTIAEVAASLHAVLVSDAEAPNRPAPATGSRR
jgi:hypothetical protein